MAPGTLLLFMSYLVATVAWAMQLYVRQEADHARLEELRARIESIDQIGTRGAGLTLQRTSILEGQVDQMGKRVERNQERIEALSREVQGLKFRNPPR